MNLLKFEQKAEKKKGKLIKFLKKLDKVVPEDLQDIVKEIDTSVWEDIDCLECANCCKTMTPTYTPKDIKRIAAHFDITPKNFKKKWLYKDENGDWMNTATPCQFLGSDNKCSIYEIRPADCSGFPHHRKKRFDLYNDTYIGNVPRCPATFELVSRLAKKVEKEYEW